MARKKSYKNKPQEINAFYIFQQRSFLVRAEVAPEIRIENIFQL
jgi:hypothetical protein